MSLIQQRFPNRRASNLPLKSPKGGWIYLIETPNGHWKAVVMADTDASGTAKRLFRINRELPTKAEVLDEVAMRFDVHYPGLAFVASVTEMPRYRPRRRW